MEKSTPKHICTCNFGKQQLPPEYLEPNAKFGQ